MKFLFSLLSLSIFENLIQSFFYHFLFNFHYYRWRFISFFFLLVGLHVRHAIHTAERVLLMRWGKAERKTFNFSFKILISNFRFFSSRCCRCRCMWDGFGRRLFLFFLFRIQKYFPRSIVMSRAAGMMMLKRSQQRACGYYKIMDRKMIYVGAYTWIFFFFFLSCFTYDIISVFRDERTALRDALRNRRKVRMLLKNVLEKFSDGGSNNGSFNLCKAKQKFYFLQNFYDERH